MDSLSLVQNTPLTMPLTCLAAAGGGAVAVSGYDEAIHLCVRASERSECVRAKRGSAARSEREEASIAVGGKSSRSERKEVGSHPLRKISKTSALVAHPPRKKNQQDERLGKPPPT
jgi:hypothetical protein